MYVFAGTKLSIHERIHSEISSFDISMFEIGWERNFRHIGQKALPIYLGTDKKKIIWNGKSGDGIGLDGMILPSNGGLNFAEHESGQKVRKVSRMLVVIRDSSDFFDDAMEMSLQYLPSSSVLSE